MQIALNIGLGIGCLVVAVLMGLIGGWFMVNGVRDKDWSAIFVAAMILALTIFALSSAVMLFIR
jgi:hypothetical protein